MFTQTIPYILERMKRIIKGEPVKVSFCHGVVALAIRERQNPDDTVIFFGEKLVHHSILWNDGVIVDTYNGKYTGEGYEWKNYFLPVMAKYKAKDLL